MYEKMMDGESVPAAKAFLECTEVCAYYHQFSDPQHVLADYRTFNNGLKPYHRVESLSEALRQNMRKMMLDGNDLVVGSWGHYAHHWIKQLKQADVDPELISDVAYDFKQHGFLPEDYQL